MSLARGLSMMVVALLVACTTIVSGDPEPVDADTTDLVSSQPLPPLGVHTPFIGGSITYLPDRTLLVADEDAESIWAIDPQDGTVQPWLSKPSFGMRPFDIRYDPTNDIVFVAGRTNSAGVGQPQYLVLDEFGSYLDRWTLPDQDDMWLTNDSANRISLMPSGFLAWITNPPPGQPGQPKSRIATVNRFGQRMLGYRCNDVYTALSANSNGQFIAKRDLPGRQGYEPGYQLDLIDRQCGQQGALYRYDGSHPYWSDSVGLASWPSLDRIFLATDLTIKVLARDGKHQFHTYVPSLCPDCRMFSIAPASNDTFAVLSADNTVGRDAASAQIIQFDRDGAPTLRTIFRPSQVPVDWMAGRITVDHRDRVHVLYPDSDRVVTIGPSGTVENESAAPSWARDIDAAGSNVALKGSAGERGAVQLRDTNGNLLWHRTCDCDATGAIALGDMGPVVANAVQPHLLSLGGEQGSDAHIVGLSDSEAGILPLDISTYGNDTYILEGINERIAVIDMEAGLRAYLDAPAGAFRIDAGPGGVLGALTHRGEVYVRNHSRWGKLNLSQAAERSMVIPRDISWTSTGDLVILDAYKPALIRLRPNLEEEPQAVAPPEVAAGQGECHVAGTKDATPQQVMLGEAVQLQLTLTIDCPAPSERERDVLLVLGGGLRGGDATEPHDYQSAAWEAAERLINGLDLTRDRVAIYQHGYGLLADFSSDRRTLHAAVRRVGTYFNPYLPADAYRYDGLGWAFQRFTEVRRPGAQQVLIQVDKSIMMTERDGTMVADQARRQDVQVLLVYRPYGKGLPADEMQRLRTMVADDRDVMNLDDVLSSDALLQRVLKTSRAPIVRDVEIWDFMSADVDLRPGSTVPRAAESVSTVSWRMDGIPSRGITVTVSVVPNRVGMILTNLVAGADFTDSTGIRRRFIFPIPQVKVLAPPPTLFPTAVSSRTPLPTFTSTPIPSKVPTIEPPVRAVSLYLPLMLTESCSPALRQADVILAIDASLSMLEVGNDDRSKLQEAVRAASMFLDELRLGQDQAAVITFNATATVAAPLTTNREALNQALGEIVPAQQTCLACAIEAGWRELQSPRHGSSHTAVLILLTDGRSNPQPASTAVALAAEAKAAGVRIYAIGLGDDLDDAALRELASSPTAYLHAPSPQELVAIYRGIAVEIPCPAVLFWSRR